MVTLEWQINVFLELVKQLLRYQFHIELYLCKQLKTCLYRKNLTILMLASIEFVFTQIRLLGKIPKTLIQKIQRSDALEQRKVYPNDIGSFGS